MTAIIQFLSLIENGFLILLRYDKIRTKRIGNSEDNGVYQAAVKDVLIRFKRKFIFLL
nr:hypothetical protein [uncultured Acetatifactor sp.]